MNLKTMKLYSQVERVHNELRARGFDADAPLKVCDLTPFDQYHYFGSEAVDLAAGVLGIGPRSRVLEIGSGIGGPARHLAETTGCEIVALELQRDLHDTAVALTRRCGLENAVYHVCGDVLGPLPSWAPFDSIVSLLVFLHISDLRRLFSVCRRLLGDDGRIFIEDFVLRRKPSPSQLDELQMKVACPDLRSLPAYTAEIQRAGFFVNAFTDMSARWTDFTRQRAAAFRDDRRRHVSVHGEEITNGLDDFYSTVAGLFAAGVVGGVRIDALSRPKVKGQRGTMGDF
jgi:cyclopropane fatty-acyl-phospholipid synthase-like methyltransferase